MQIGDLVVFKATGKVGIIRALTQPVPNEALVVWNDGVTGWIAVWGLEALCK